MRCEEDEELGLRRAPGGASKEAANEWNARKEGYAALGNVPLPVRKATENDRLAVKDEELRRH